LKPINGWYLWYKKGAEIGEVAEIDPIARPAMLKDIVLLNVLFAFLSAKINCSL
jgi:hypothetical protein